LKVKVRSDVTAEKSRVSVSVADVSVTVSLPPAVGENEGVVARGAGPGVVALTAATARRWPPRKPRGRTGPQVGRDGAEKPV
jgi:hypothetical protein